MAAVATLAALPTLTLAVFAIRVEDLDLSHRKVTLSRVFDRGLFRALTDEQGRS
jgi:hypothetical protein